MKYSKYSVVIIGSGISGLFLANKLAQKNNLSDGVLIITKEELFSGSSSLAQGGIVSVIPEINPKDSIESHINDTIKAGCGLNNLNTVKMVSEASSQIAQDLIHFGVKFDLNDKNMLNFTLEGAHSCPRNLHADGDSTGRIIEKTLCDSLESAQNVELYSDTMALEILVDKNEVARGLIAYHTKTNEYEAIYTNNIVIATGGIGQIYKNTTNPTVSTGDGIALAYKAGAEVENMEFVQFHPTALYVQNKETMPLVSESVRGEGAKLIDLNGDYFAKNYHHSADLAPRDVVSRAIISQLKLTDTTYVNLDISQMGIEKFKKRFPTITSLCEENNVDISNGLIPVAPAQHYFMGGIKTDLDTRTNIKNLYAIGECASTGLHGANRLASNSLLECAVFADKLSEILSSNAPEPPKKFDGKIKSTIDKYSYEDNQISDDLDDFLLKMRKDLKSIMTKYVGISRTKTGLKEAIEALNQLELELNQSNSTPSRLKYELENSICVAKLITSAALNRNNSIGAHYRADFPHKAIEMNKIKDNNENAELLAR